MATMIAMTSSRCHADDVTQWPAGSRGNLDSRENAKPKEDWVYLRNNHVEVGLLRSHGGAIGSLKLRGEGHNFLNHYDHGRLVQQSYYGDSDDSDWAGKPWRYNPVQGGGYRGTPATVLKFQATEISATAITEPRHWATGKSLPECEMHQRIRLQGPLVRLDFEFAYRGEAKHRPRHQETPAVFVDARFGTLVTPAGDRKGGRLTRRRPGWPNESVALDRSWAAYVDDQDKGVGILVPGVTEATCYRYQSGAGGEADCSYIAPLQTFALEPGLKFSYRAFLTAGKLIDIQERFGSVAEE
ncbi:MAG: hypothetical protein AAF802_14060 [Planctomycetota bacterium]